MPGLEQLLAQIYPDLDPRGLAERARAAIGQPEDAGIERRGHWSEADLMVIAYGDMVRDATRSPLASLADFVRSHLEGSISAVHVLPFFPYSSDDGFSVIDFMAVDPDLGTWIDVASLASDHDLMVDVVANHVSAESAWFAQFVAAEEPGRSYLMTAEPDDDLGVVVRPRNHELLRRVETSDGPRHLWCTFGYDQIDLDYRNPDVLVELLRIVDHYLRHGARFLRLDAIAYLWKRAGTACIHLPETHALIKVLRLLLAERKPDARLVTETNVPTTENLRYFGDGDEAHIAYNFGLPPLIIHGLVAGTARPLADWLSTAALPPSGCTYLNFIASHDGIGVRPIEDVLDGAEIDALVAAVLDGGGHVSTYVAPDGLERPYELNVSLFDALGRSPQRMICAHAVMLALKGIPAIYLHSLLATPSDHDAVARTGAARSINRSKLDRAEIDADPGPVFHELCRIMAIRRHEPAFHPDAPQRVVDLGDAVLAIERADSLLALANLTDRIQVVAVGQAGIDLISGAPLGPRITLAPHQPVWLQPSRRPSTSRLS